MDRPDLILAFNELHSPRTDLGGFITAVLTTPDYRPNEPPLSAGEQAALIQILGSTLFKRRRLIAPIAGAYIPGNVYSFPHYPANLFFFESDGTATGSPLYFMDPLLNVVKTTHRNILLDAESIGAQNATVWIPIGKVVLLSAVIIAGAAVIGPATLAAAGRAAIQGGVRAASAVLRVGDRAAALILSGLRTLASYEIAITRILTQSGLPLSARIAGLGGVVAQVGRDIASTAQNVYVWVLSNPIRTTETVVQGSEFALELVTGAEAPLISPGDEIEFTITTARRASIEVIEATVTQKGTRDNILEIGFNVDAVHTTQNSEIIEEALNSPSIRVTSNSSGSINNRGLANNGVVRASTAAERRALDQRKIEEGIEEQVGSAATRRNPGSSTPLNENDFGSISGNATRPNAKIIDNLEEIPLTDIPTSKRQEYINAYPKYREEVRAGRRRGNRGRPYELEDYIRIRYVYENPHLTFGSNTNRQLGSIGGIERAAANILETVVNGLLGIRQNLRRFPNPFGKRYKNIIPDHLPSGTQIIFLNRNGQLSQTPTRIRFSAKFVGDSKYLSSKIPTTEQIKGFLNLAQYSDEKRLLLFIKWLPEYPNPGTLSRGIIGFELPMSIQQELADPGVLALAEELGVMITFISDPKWR